MLFSAMLVLAGFFGGALFETEQQTNWCDKYMLEQHTRLTNAHFQLAQTQGASDGVVEFWANPATA